MSWLYLPERAADCSAQSGCSDGEQCATSKGIDYQNWLHKLLKNYLLPCIMMDSSMTHRSVWISLLRDFRASRSVGQGKGLASGMREIFGLIPFASLEKCSLNGYYWKMSQGCFPILISDEFSKTWPRAGMIRGGIAFLLQPLARITRGIVSGLWPTPTKDAANERRKRYAQGCLPLSYAVRVWPTPTVADSRNTRNSTANRKKIPPTGIHKGDTLVDAVTKWPAPTARDCYGRGPSEADRNSSALNHVATGGAGGKLNPNWVEWLMGWPIGWTDSEPLGKDRFREWWQSFGGY